MRASGSSIPSNLPMLSPNCLRTRAWAPATRAAWSVPAVEVAGSEMPRPAARLCMSIRQPLPAPLAPPITASSSLTTTPWPSVGQL